MDSVNRVFFTHMKDKKTFYFSLRLLQLVHEQEQALDVISNLCQKRGDWVAVVYDNEWYPGVVAEVG